MTTPPNRVDMAAEASAPGEEGDTGFTADLLTRAVREIIASRSVANGLTILAWVLASLFSAGGIAFVIAGFQSEASADRFVLLVGGTSNVIVGAVVALVLRALAILVHLKATSVELSLWESDLYDDADSLEG